MGLTRAGTLLALASAGAMALAWVFGLPEVAMAGAAGAVLVVIALLWVRIGSPDLQIRRAARPPRLEVGGRCEIRLVTRNVRRRTSPVVTLEDRVGTQGTARLVLAPLSPGDRCVATYTLPTTRRGLHHVGPLTATVEDPFGLVRRTRADERVQSVIVLPRTWRLDTLPAAPGDEPEHGTRSLTSGSTVDEEFATLREYVPGDDVRRIHWRSTARLGAPVVRQFDVPWQRRTTVVLDLRSGPDETSFELAVSAAASVVQLVARRDELVRVLTTDGADTGFLPAAEHLDELMDRLAVVTTSPPRRDRPQPLLAALDRLGAHGNARVVTCTAGLDDRDADALGVTGHRLGVHIVVGTRPGSPRIAAPGTIEVRASDGPALVAAWQAATARPRPEGVPR